MSDEGSSDDYSSDSPYDYASSDDSVVEDVEELPSASPWSRALAGGGSDEVVALCAHTCCKNECLVDKEVAVGCFLFSVSRMSKKARKTAFLTSLATSMFTDTGKRKQGRGERVRFTYLAPFVGQVCRKAFQLLYNVSNDTLTVARAQVADGHAYAKHHGNVDNAHAATLDRGDIIAWFHDVAAVLGEPCPVRLRHQHTKAGIVTRFTTVEEIIFLPAYLTWEKLFDQYKLHLEEMEKPPTPPSFSAFFQLLRKRCKNVRIRSPRSNVCDICSVYQVYQSRTATVIETENQASHVLDARAMRQQYAKDTGLVSPEHIVSTMDFAQNVALPHSAATPSAWYFMSLINVNVFGVFNENTKKQTNYFYSERRAGKGSNEVVSMLHKFAVDNGIYTREKGTRAWTIYADNCGAQNKNNHLIRFLLFLVDSGRLRAVNLHFFVKGHTKNNCDRGFATFKRAYAKQNLYTLDHVGNVANSCSTTNSGVCLEGSRDVFLDWKAVLQPQYRDLKNIQSYQLFSMSSAQPGVVTCRKRPTAPEVDQQLGKNVSVDFETVWKSFKPSALPTVNAEKVADLHKKILQYIPDEFRDDPLYRAPTDQESADAAQKKKRRRKTTPTLLERRRATAESSDAEDAVEGQDP